MNHSTKTICLVAGRSGGHILPGFTLVQQALMSNTYDNVLLITTNTPLDHTIAKQAPMDIEHVALSLNNVPWRNPFRWPFFLVQCVRAFIQSFNLLRRTRPAQIISMGGYLSLPVCLAARFLRIPIAVYELNVTPGMATKWLSTFVTNLYVCFEKTQQYFPYKACTVIPYPVRFSQQDKNLSSLTARTYLNLNPTKKIILIIGGSQGSLFLNQSIKQWLALNTHVHPLVQIIHQTGAHDVASWKALYDTYEIPAIVFAYRQDLAQIYQAADLVICRAGAGTLFEVLFFNKPALVIPLETRATDHQAENARVMAHQYPALFTILYEHGIKTNNTVLFSTINKYLYTPSATPTEHAVHAS